MIAGLRAQVAERDAVVEALLARVEVLEARLGKNSKNSSKPPSSDDPFTKPPPRSLRGKSGRRPGKQPGEPGSRLEPHPDPDRIVPHVPHRCAGCGGDLADAPVIARRRRQVFDLPAIHLEVVEHVVEVRACECGHHTEAVFPGQVSAPTCYGPGLAAVATYLLARQHLPVARTAELLADCYSARVSTGWLAGLLADAEARLAGFARLAREQLQAAPVAHFDETGARVAGRLWWVHVACTPHLTLYHRAPGRGKDSINAGGVLPAFTGIGIHDGLTSYQGYPDMGHGLCNAHHLRELIALTEANQRSGNQRSGNQRSGNQRSGNQRSGNQRSGNHGHTTIAWPQAMIDLLVEINTAVNHAKTTGKTTLPAHRLANYRRRYRTVIAQGHQAHPTPPPTGRQGRPRLGVAGSLLRRLDIYQDDVLRFATDFTVPFDNNQAERDLRMIRVQQKISGSWRSEVGADAYLAVRSYLSTARKHSRNSLDVLHDLFTGTPWLPAPT